MGLLFSSGTIEPDEFLKMMVRRPWSAMLPGDVIDQMPQAVAETLVESKPQKNFRKELQTKAAKEAASAAVRTIDINRHNLCGGCR